jgi:uncharacterized membrane protein YphA (DoxX/SURF4 family)
MEATISRTAMPGPFGWRVYGAGLIALALVCLASGHFVLAQPVHLAAPLATALAYATAMLLIVAGVAVETPRTTARGAAAVAIFYALVIVLADGAALLRNPKEYVVYSGTAEQVAVLAGALVLYATYAGLDAARSARLVRIGQRVFGVCALLFGGAHFVYLAYTIPWVPAYLPPSPAFWAVATGVFHIAGGLAILAGIQARLAAILLTVMYAAFTPLVHVPRLLANVSSLESWTENAINLSLVGVAWVVADSLVRARR